MENKNDPTPNHTVYNEYIAFQNPALFATQTLIEKNLWLTRIRWIYLGFIFLFFIFQNTFQLSLAIQFNILAIIIFISIGVNAVFVLALKRGIRFPSEKHDFKLFMSLATIQLDFDLVILSFLIYFSGGLNSPIIALYLFYIMLSTFLFQYKKALRNTVTAIILLIVIFLSNDQLILTHESFLPLITYSVILLFTFFISSYLSRNMKKSEEQLHSLLIKTGEMSVTDGLTNLYNQTHFFLLLRLQLEKAKRYGSPFSLILFDVDHFKNYNDRNGHLKGSAALKRIGELMRGIFRSSDILAKYGGDEFIIILPHSDKVGAFLAADRLRELVEEERFDGRQFQPLGKITISIGISSFPEHGETIEELINNADKALYFAKNTGRNKTIIFNMDMENSIE